MEAVVTALKRREEAKMDETKRAMVADPPVLLEHATLHDYQLRGLRWLLSKRAQGLGAILGDEMGLGKTLQIIAFVASLIQTSDSSKSGARYLIVAPLSVLPNWMDQFAQFAPKVSTLMYIGAQAERSPLKQKIKGDGSKHLVVVTSYEMMLFDTELFGSIDWEVIVFDEGHRLKNRKSRLFEAISSHFQKPQKLVLSGTPIQNDLGELFALLSLLNPDIFHDYALFEATFREYFSAKTQQLDSTAAKDANPKLLRAQQCMKRILEPLLLLRTIQDVNDSFTLPPISEIIVHTPMSAMQRVYYKEVVARNVDVINSVATDSSKRTSLVNVLPHLRKACNHPYLFPGAEPEPFQEGSHLYENSGKLYVLHQILPRLRDAGHVVLLFSQSTAFLDIIQDFLTLESFSYERIDGSVRGKERWQSIERFRSDPNVFVFLISTRSGGVGLNLQRADTVIFMDSDYNPQADLQAVARAYRLGQTKPIHVIKFVCANTVEESIYRRALKKMQMADKIRNIARSTKLNNDSSAMSGEESEQTLLEMIQFGLHKLMEDASEDALVKPLDEEYIEHILSRKTGAESVPDPSSAGHAFKNEQLLESGGDFNEENMYYFEGEDYSKVVENKARDQDSFRKLCARAGAGSTARRTMGLQRARYELDDSGDDLDDSSVQEDEKERARQREERRQKTVERKLANWKANGYQSMVIDPTTDFNGDATEATTTTSITTDNTTLLHFRAGDASRPRQENILSNAFIIVHCVDKSGVWSSRGFFRSLSSLSPSIQRQYEAAGRNDDLKLGSAHLIPLPHLTIDNGDGSSESVERYACLLVVQGFLPTKGAKKKQRVANGALIRHGKSTMFRLNALDQALDALASRARSLNASVHMPRIGYGTPNFNWYAVERLIKRNLRDRGVDTSIYYFSRN